MGEKVVEFDESGESRRISTPRDAAEAPETPQSAELAAIVAETEPNTAAERKAVEKVDERSLMAALQLKLRGATYAEIADVLEYKTPGRAKAVVEKALASMAMDDSSVASMRQMMSLRYEAALKSLSRKALSDTITIDDPKRPGQKITVANDEHLAYVREFKGVLDSMSRLYGVNAPTTVALVTPAAEEFNKVINMMVLEVSEGKAGAEADIFDFEEGVLVEDEPES